MSNWHIFKVGHDSEEGIKQHDGIERLPAPPPWRQPRHATNQEAPDDQVQTYWENLQKIASEDIRDYLRGRTFCLRTHKEQVVDAVNAALYLRRPLLVTGKPGSGKTSLAYAIAYELKLGPVLVWSITTRSMLKNGLYEYDAIARLQEAQLSQPQVGQQLYDAIARLQGTQLDQALSSADVSKKPADPYSTIGQYISLGPLGTAFLPTPYPRVLLIDEIDKSDINLPNDLLNLLEEGEFEIPELVRLAKRDSQPVVVRTADSLETPIRDGRIRCQSFPLIVMTSNGERDFPPAFLRRCLRVSMPTPSEEDLKSIVQAHLGEEITQQFTDIVNLIEEFSSRSESEAANLATDQLLNAVYLRTRDAKVQELKSLLFAPLNNIDENG